MLEILRFSTLIVENCCFNRHLYASIDRLNKLLKLDDTDIVLSVLSLLAAFVTKIQLRVHAHSQPIPPSLNTTLFYLAKGWGGKQDGLGLLYCCQQEDVGAKVTQISFAFLSFFAHTNHNKISARNREYVTL